MSTGRRFTLNMVKITELCAWPLRFLLIVTLLFYLPGAGIFTVKEGKTAQNNPLAEEENGVGGGIQPEEIEAAAGTDLELLGVPEPEEYSRPRMLSFNSYKMVSGDIIGKIAAEAGLYEDTLISVNNVKNTRTMQIGQIVKIPNQDGIYHIIKESESLESIAEKYNTTVLAIKTVNELFSDKISPNSSLFIPGAKLDWVNKQEINGDLFIWPVNGYITSNYGYRTSPFDSGIRQFHSGLDIGAVLGTPIRAAMAGRVLYAGVDDSFGNYVVISHHSGYRTLYAHMSVIRVKAGAYVGTGERIGDVGISGITTGAHLHFTVYKDGVTVNPKMLMK